MYDRWLPDPPAHPGLRPDEGASPASDHEASLLAGFGATEPVRLAAPGAFRAHIDGREAFVRLLPARRVERLLAADRLAAHIEAAGTPVARLLPGFPCDAGEGALAVAMPYVHGRHPTATEDELEQVGAVLRTLHAALRSFPGAADVRARAARRHELLENRLAAMAEGVGPLGPRPQETSARVRAWLGRRPSAAPDAQVIHGDINPGNLILGTRDALPTVLDLEDALVSYDSPVEDLAAAIERLVLVPVEYDTRDAVPLIAALLEGYGGGDGVRDQLVTRLAWRSLRALALLAELSARGRANPTSEWQKFLSLLEGLDRVGR